ncbi:putative transposase, partial [Neisseria meningitidis 2005172]
GRHYAQSLPQPSAAEANQTNRIFEDPYMWSNRASVRCTEFRYARAAYFGLIKVSAQSHLKAMCLNLLKAANKLSAPAAA